MNELFGDGSKFLVVDEDEIRLIEMLRKIPVDDKVDVKNELIERVARALAQHDYPSCGFDGMHDVGQRGYRAKAHSVLAELAGELRNGTCEWWEDGEMWESSCGVAYMFNSDGPEDNGHRFCHKCGNRIAIDEARGSMIVR